MKWILIVLCCFTIGSSFANPPSSSSQIPLLNKMTSISTMTLGDGYSTYNRLAMGESALRLNQMHVTYTNMQNSVNLSQTIHREDLAKDLNVNISVSGGWGLFSASASANFLRHIEDTQYSENFTFSERYYVHEVLDIGGLPANTSALTANAASLFKKSGISAFTNRYGDMFIKELPMGAFLVVNLRLTFASALDKEKFDGSLGGGFGSIFHASATIQSAVTSSRARGVIEVAAYQLGGDPTELPNIFSEKTTGGYYITTCSLDNLKDCQGAIDGIIKYAQINFNQQIKPKKIGEKPEGHLVVVGEPVLEAYASKFNMPSAPSLDAVTIINRLDLAGMHHTARITKNFFDHLMFSPVSGYLTPAANKALKDIHEKLNWNWSLFDQFGAVQCYLPGQETRCKDIISNIKKYSKEVDANLIDYYMNTGFYEIQADCTYTPVSTPDEDHPTFANFCAGRWINGVYTFKLAGDKSTLEVHSDYVDQGYHMQAAGMLTPEASYTTYAGVARFHNLSTNVWFNHPISIRLTKNRI